MELFVRLIWKLCDSITERKTISRLALFVYLSIYCEFFCWLISFVSGRQVERKASKGRKVRYNTHAKLQNFLFPVPAFVEGNGGIDAEKLFQSLFQ
jgi:hypothetical protein